jgi:hypothetical protein
MAIGPRCYIQRASCITSFGLIRREIPHWVVFSTASPSPGVSHYSSLHCCAANVGDFVVVLHEGVIGALLIPFWCLTDLIPCIYRAIIADETCNVPLFALSKIVS